MIVVKVTLREFLEAIHEETASERRARRMAAERGHISRTYEEPKEKLPPIVSPRRLNIGELSQAARSMADEVIERRASENWRSR